MSRYVKYLVYFSIAISSCSGKKTVVSSDIEYRFEWFDSKPADLRAKRADSAIDYSFEPAPVKITEADVASKDSKAEAITKFTLHWEGTPHRIGGMSREGVDCSGFTVLMFEKIFDHRFTARRSADLFAEVEPVKRVDLQPGDLVFFRIKGRRIDHVGVYVGDGIFAHASVRKGVIFSKLTEPYYDQRFYMGGRVQNQYVKEGFSIQ